MRGQLPFLQLAIAPHLKKSTCFYCTNRLGMMI